MKGTTAKGLYKERYGLYYGIYRHDDRHIYLTTDRYFEKYVLHTDDGIYEIWAGGFKKKDELSLADFEVELRFAAMEGLEIVDIKTVPDTSLKITFNSGSYFEIGLCPEYNRFNHPERYMKFAKNR